MGESLIAVKIFFIFGFQFPHKHRHLAVLLGNNICDPAELKLVILNESG